MSEKFLINMKHFKPQTQFCALDKNLIIDSYVHAHDSFLLFLRADQSAPPVVRSSLRFPLACTVLGGLECTLRSVFPLFSGGSN